MYQQFDCCTLCPRECRVNRNAGQLGFCKAGTLPKVARCALHFWEEPCLSGINGSGTVFFSHCTLGCVFCQNNGISHLGQGREVTAERLSEMFFELEQKGAHNINLVTPTHYLPPIIEAVKAAKDNGLAIPIVYNCGGYESVETIRALAPYIDIWLPDFKYFSPALGQKYSSVCDYPQTALSAIAEMVKLSGRAVLNLEDMMTRGVLVRHLLLPGKLADSIKAVTLLYESFGDDIILSLMSQYTPPAPNSALEKTFPELLRRVNQSHYEALVNYASELGISRCYVQNTASANESFVPSFNCEGV